MVKNDFHGARRTSHTRDLAVVCERVPKLILVRELAVSHKLQQMRRAEW